MAAPSADSRAQQCADQLAGDHAVRGEKSPSAQDDGGRRPADLATGAHSHRAVFTGDASAIAGRMAGSFTRGTQPFLRLGRAQASGSASLCAARARWHDLSTPLIRIRTHLVTTKSSKSTEAVNRDAALPLIAQIHQNRFPQQITLGVKNEKTDRYPGCWPVRFCCIRSSSCCSCRRTGQGIGTDGSSCRCIGIGFR